MTTTTPLFTATLNVRSVHASSCDAHLSTEFVSAEVDEIGDGRATLLSFPADLGAFRCGDRLRVTVEREA